MENTTLVAVDRSTAQGSFAVVRDGATLAIETFSESFPRSPEWFPALVSRLAALGIGPSQVAGYVVGTGPGSFSGIRAVLAAAQGLAMPSGAPVWGVLSSSAAAYAAYRRTGATKVAVLGDARRGTLWLARCDFSGGFDAAAAAPGLVPYASAGETLAGLNGWMLLSPDAERVQPILERNGVAPARLEEAAPGAEDVAEFFLAFPGAATRDPVPAYLHPAVVPGR